jgi:hypothetical protein
MPLMVSGILVMWFAAPLVGMADVVGGWLTLGVGGAMMVTGGIAELWP